MARNEDSIENARCSFCGKSQSQVNEWWLGQAFIFAMNVSSSVKK
jgi:hypothetical protein